MRPQTVSVLGGGGSLGLRFLPMLRTASEAKIRCLVRGSKLRLDETVRDCVDEVVVGDILDSKTSQEMCSEVDVIVSMLTPTPTHENFVEHHVKNLEAIINVAKKTQGRPPRLVIVGGAGVMERSWPSNCSVPVAATSKEHELNKLVINAVASRATFIEAKSSQGSFVTDTFPGMLIKRVLPIYNDFFIAHKLNLKLLQDSGLRYTMICPGFLRESPCIHEASEIHQVRTWVNVNDEYFGGLSATYEDVARLLVDEVKHGTHSGHGIDGARVGIESPYRYYPSLIPSTINVACWQLRKWLGRRGVGYS